MRGGAPRPARFQAGSSGDRHIIGKGNFGPARCTRGSSRNAESTGWWSKGRSATNRYRSPRGCDHGWPARWLSAPKISFPRRRAGNTANCVISRELVVRDLQSSNGTFHRPEDRRPGRGSARPDADHRERGVPGGGRAGRGSCRSNRFPTGRHGRGPGRGSRRRRTNSDFEIEAEDITTVAPAVRPRGRRSSRLLLLLPKEPDEDALIELGEDDVADFLLDLDADPKEKK